MHLLVLDRTISSVNVTVNVVRFEQTGGLLFSNSRLINALITIIDYIVIIASIGYQILLSILFDYLLIRQV